VCDLGLVSKEVRCGLRVSDIYSMASSTDKHGSLEQTLQQENVMITPSLVPKRVCTRTVRKGRVMFTSFGGCKFHCEHNCHFGWQKPSALRRQRSPRSPPSVCSRFMGELPSQLFVLNNQDQSSESHLVGTSSRGGLGLKLTKAPNAY